MRYLILPFFFVMWLWCAVAALTLYAVCGIAKAIGIELKIEGKLPSAGDTYDVFINAIRECLTNCVRHADGTALFIKVYGDAADDTVTLTNNGKAMQNEIVPRGGLSNLMKRVGYPGGTMQMQSLTA